MTPAKNERMISNGGGSGGATLIPRNIIRFMVFGLLTDIFMDSRRTKRKEKQPQPTSIVTPFNEGISHDTDLHGAARRGDLAAVSRGCGDHLISRHDSHGNLPLHLAVINGHKEVAAFLVGQDPNGSYVLNRDKKSPLYLAVEGCHTDLVDCMLKALGNDTEFFSKVKLGKSILHAAITHQNKEMVKIILKHRRILIKLKDGGMTPLSYASYKGHIDIVRYLLENFPESISDRDDDHSFPVHKACLGGHVEVLKIFYSILPKSLFQEDNNGRNILHLAAKERGNKLKDVVSYLLSLASSSNSTKKSLNKEDGYGYKPLALAELNRNNEVAQLLNAARMH